MPSHRLRLWKVQLYVLCLLLYPLSRLRNIPLDGYKTARGQTSLDMSDKLTFQIVDDKPNSPPLVTFSTGNAFYFEGLLGSQPSNNAAEWRASRVIFAEITPAASAFTICPVLSCGLSEYPLSPIIEMIIPETGMTVECHEPTLTVSVMRMSPIDGTRTKFYLRFDRKLDFWSFMETMSQLKSEEETHLANIMSYLMHVRDTVPTHLRGQTCENGAHAVGVAEDEMVGDSASDSTLTP